LEVPEAYIQFDCPLPESELEQLMKEADAQEALNLQRLASRLPDWKKKS